MATPEELPERLRNHEQVQAFERNREAFRDDPYRPDYHFTPPGGTLHDPNGACYWNGRYHLFYQFWPPDRDEARPWDEAMHWGHAVSDDLLHWQDLPVALSAATGLERSCYSGQALVEDDRVVLMYHGPGAGNCIATSDDPFLATVEKHPDNPVVPIDEDAPYRVFDPCLWHEDGTYYSLSGSYAGGERGEDSRDVQFLFRSGDLSEWEYLGPLVEGGFHTDPGEDGAVPNFFPLGEKHVLLFFSHASGPQYYVGDYDADAAAFDVESHGRMNYGPLDHSNLHAPSTLCDDDGRRIAVFNVREGLDRGRRPWEGWTEVLSLPRVLGVDDGGLTVEAPAELATLRENRRDVEPGSIPSNGERILAERAGASIEVAADIAPGAAAEVGLTVLRSPDGEETTRITYWNDVDALGIDTAESTLHEDSLGRPPEVGPLELGDGERLRLRVFVDRSIVEVFANGRQCLTTRVYPERADSVGVAAFAGRGRARLESVDVWEMRDVWQ